MASPEPAPLERRLPREGASADALLEAFLDYVGEKGLDLYAAQEEAILEIMSGHHVVLNTPTGSGKSLVALAAHFRALARGERSFYTAPIKALVSEKFFDLCRVLGADNVGMMTGDASVNREAPILCCTAEILANLALREGDSADIQSVVMDEFHYYSDRDRGAAWQIPLLTLPQAQFVLMSATMGRTEFFIEELDRTTQRSAALVKSDERPVPLDFEYRETPLLETIQDLVSSGRVPVYIVHFSQRAASERAQALMSIDFLSKEDKQAIKRELAGFRFDSPYGADLRRFVHHGVGVHHAGLLPKYRRMVERLAQKGLLRLICGTDTLGVGVNVPIRSVLFTQLCKYDGQKTAVLSVRDFKQIAGRAGRRGYDSRGSVIAQAPEHVIENKQMESKAGGDAKKLRKLVRKKPPDRGYAHWDEAVFERLIASEPEELKSSFDVTHGMILQLLERPGNGCQAIKDTIRSSHENRVMKRRLGRRAIQLFRSLLAADVIELRSRPDPDGRMVQVNRDLQEDFSLNQSLSLWILETIPKLEADAPDYPLNVVTLCEAVLENPAVVLQKQLDKLKTDTVNELKAEGVEYDQRMEVLDALEHPKPLRDFIYETFNEFREAQPWVGDNIRPKSIARDMYERAMSFREYVKEYGLRRSEGVLLRYLSDAYKALMQNVPEDAKTDELYDVTDWLGAVVRQVDSSLLDEWEAIRNPAQALEEVKPEREEAPDILRDERAFVVLLRNAVFRLVQKLARRDYDGARELVANDLDWPPERLGEALAPFFEEYQELRVDPPARAPSHTRVTKDEDAWTVAQTLLDPKDHGEWQLQLRLDLAQSRQEQAPVLTLEGVGPTD